VLVSNTNKTHRLQCLSVTQTRHRLQCLSVTQTRHSLQCLSLTQTRHTGCSASQWQTGCTGHSACQQHKIHKDYSTFLFFITSDNVVKHGHWLEICTTEPTVSYFCTLDAPHTLLLVTMSWALRWKIQRLRRRHSDMMVGESQSELMASVTSVRSQEKHRPGRTRSGGQSPSPGTSVATLTICMLSDNSSKQSIIIIHVAL
jgi:hypothetical protein